jgi:hypothetical protein
VADWCAYPGIDRDLSDLSLNHYDGAPDVECVDGDGESISNAATGHISSLIRGGGA